MHSKALREKVKRDYNAIAGEFSKSRQRDWKEFEVFRPYLKKGMRVLDLGCGNGRLVDFLSEWRVNYTGMDQSEELVKLARRAHPNEHFEVADMAELPAMKEKWDAIFMVASFHHLPRKEQLRVLKWVVVHLEKDGLLFMTNWNLFQWRFAGTWFKTLFWPRWGFKGLGIPWKGGVRRYYYAFTARELRKLLRAAGFTLLEEQKGRNFVTIARV